MFCLLLFVGVNGSDVAIVRAALSRYSRQELGRSTYEVPLSMRDTPSSSQAPLEEVRFVVLTIESTNEHPMESSPESRMGVIAYTYKGQFDDVSCGRTYVRDLDDWDLPDKTFTCVSGCITEFVEFT